MANLPSSTSAHDSVIRDPRLAEVYRMLARHAAGLAEAFKTLQKIEEDRRTHDR